MRLWKTQIIAVSQKNAGWWQLFQIFWNFQTLLWVETDPIWRFAYFSSGWRKNHQLVIDFMAFFASHYVCWLIVMSLSLSSNVESLEWIAHDFHVGNSKSSETPGMHPSFWNILQTKLYYASSLGSSRSFRVAKAPQTSKHFFCNTFVFNVYIWWSYIYIWTMYSQYTYYIMLHCCIC